MVGHLLERWMSDGISVEITEAEVIADLDSWFVGQDLAVAEDLRP